MLTTLVCVAVAVLSPLAVGLPVRGLLRRGRPLDERAWLEVPLIGLACIILVGQNLAYLDVPVRRSMPWLWLGTAGLWGWWLWRGSPRASFRSCPAATFAVALAVYLFQAIGLFTVGADAYLGRFLGDQYSYVSMASFLADHLYSTSAEALSRQPGLLPGLALRDNRIGQSILQAFFLATARRDAFALYEPTSLLAPALLALAFYGLARRWGRGRGPALVFAAAVGVMPAVTWVHLTGYLSHVLALPLLFFLMLLLDQAVREPGPENAAVAMLAVATLASVYTEFLPLAAGLAVLGVAGAAVLRVTPWRAAAALLPALLLAPVLLNPLYFKGMRAVLAHVNEPSLGDSYRPLLGTKGLMFVWVGDVIYCYCLWPPAVIRGVAIALTCLGLLGVLALAARAVRWGRGGPSVEPGQRAVWLLGLMALALTLLPLATLLHRPPLPYQHIKTLVTVAPLLALGVFTLARRPRAQLAAAAALLAVGATGTLHMVRDSVRLDSRLAPGARASADGDMLAMSGALRRLAAGRQLVLVVGEREEGHDLRNGWLAYHALRHRTWVVDQQLGHISVAGYPGQGPAALEGLAGDVHLLLDRGAGIALASPARAECVERAGRFELWRLVGDRWAFVSRAERRGGSRYELELISRCDGQMRLCLPWRDRPAPVRVETDGGPVIEAHPCDGAVAVPVGAGRTLVTLTAPSGDAWGEGAVWFDFLPAAE